MDNFVFFSGSFNPPGIHHIEITKILVAVFDRVFITPCGQRLGKSFIDPIHRRAMVNIAFDNINKVLIDFKDLENNTFTRNYEIEESSKNIGVFWYAVGSDLIFGGGRKNSDVHKNWKNGFRLWSKLNFAILERPGFALKELDLPPKHMVIKVNYHSSSTKIREAIASKNNLDDLLTSDVISYICEHELYQEKS